VAGTCSTCWAWPTRPPPFRPPSRVASARALANEPTLLLADEPTGALDSDSSHEIVELLGRLNRNGQTILLVTHDADVATAAERRVTMRDGRVVDESAPFAASPGDPPAGSGTFADAGGTGHDRPQVDHLRGDASDPAAVAVLP
jgi:energy-coupling factor transporter ATP-binding protein EcfA2